MLQATGKTRIFSANGFFARPDEEGIKTSQILPNPVIIRVFSRALMKKGLRLGSDIHLSPQQVFSRALMKKGLRPGNDFGFHTPYSFFARPDEEGIKTLTTSLNASLVGFFRAP